MCETFECYNVLSEGDFLSPQQTVSEVFQSAVETADVLRGIQIACYDQGGPFSERSTFFQLVVSNRGVSMEFFPTRDAGVAWLGIE
jgi:hypothetical protein